MQQNYHWEFVTSRCCRLTDRGEPLANAGATPAPVSKRSSLQPAWGAAQLPPAFSSHVSSPVSPAFSSHVSSPVSANPKPPSSSSRSSCWPMTLGAVVSELMPPPFAFGFQALAGGGVDRLILPALSGARHTFAPCHGGVSCTPTCGERAWSQQKHTSFALSLLAAALALAAATLALELLEWREVPSGRPPLPLQGVSAWRWSTALVFERRRTSGSLAACRFRCHNEVFASSSRRGRMTCKFPLTGAPFVSSIFCRALVTLDSDHLALFLDTAERKRLRKQVSWVHLCPDVSYFGLKSALEHGHV